jgi:hypothetical protein
VETSPFAALSLIAAPALMTNAASLLAMSTSNRLGRTVDRTRSLAREIEAAGAESDPHLLRSLTLAQTRVLITIRALTAIYFALGAFAAATLCAFIGAVVADGAGTVILEGAVIATVVFGAIAFLALIAAAALLIRESWLAYRLMSDEAAVALARAKRLPPKLADR